MRDSSKLKAFISLTFILALVELGNSQVRKITENIHNLTVHRHDLAVDKVRALRLDQVSFLLRSTIVVATDVQDKWPDSSSLEAVNRHLILPAPL